MPRHHLPLEWIVAESAGTNEAALSLLIEVHCTLCPQCRSLLDRADGIASECLEQASPLEVSDADFEAILARLDDEVFEEVTDPRFPAPLAPFTAGRDWRWIAPWLSAIDLPVLAPANHPMRLLKMTQGTALPHRDAGEERAVVLTGGFTDETGHYERGDVYHSQGVDRHDQRVDLGEDCIALVYNDGPVVLPGYLDRIFKI